MYMCKPHNHSNNSNHKYNMSVIRPTSQLHQPLNPNHNLKSYMSKPSHNTLLANYSKHNHTLPTSHNLNRHCCVNNLKSFINKLLPPSQDNNKHNRNVLLSTITDKMVAVEAVVVMALAVGMGVVMVGGLDMVGMDWALV